MKIIIVAIVLAFLLSLSLSPAVSAAPSVSAETVSEQIRKAAPTAFGYVDNTEYYMQYYFHGLLFVDDSCIVISAESTNFNEFGVFHVKNTADAKRCEKQLKAYLSESEARFRSGVVYDIDQYPKFENATVCTIDNFVFYMILEPSQIEVASRAVSNFLK